MKKPDRLPIGRVVAAFLILTLILPSPLWAYRPEGPEAALALRQTGLEESSRENGPKKELIAALTAPAAGLEEIGGVEVMPSVLAERMRGLATVWNGYTSADNGTMAGDDFLPALAPNQVTIDFPGSVP